MTASDEPQRIVAALEAAGWEPERHDTCTWLTRRGHPAKLLVHTDPNHLDYGDEVDTLVAVLADMDVEGRAARQVLDALTSRG